MKQVLLIIIWFIPVKIIIIQISWSDHEDKSIWYVFFLYGLYLINLCNSRKYRLTNDLLVHTLHLKPTQIFRNIGHSHRPLLYPCLGEHCMGTLHWLRETLTQAVSVIFAAHEILKIFSLLFRRAVFLHPSHLLNIL